MSNFCILQPVEVEINNGNVVNQCQIQEKVVLDQNLWNYNNIYKNNVLNRYPYQGVIPKGPATGSWPCRNQQSCNFFDSNNPIIPENIRKIDLLSLPPN